MANGIEKLLEMDLKEITKRTHIETEYLEYMCEKNYEKLRKLNASGFAKIISREYGLDLQDWIDEYNAYCKENGCAGSSHCSVAPKIPAYTPKSDNSKALTIILIIALIVVAIIWLIKFTNILDGIKLTNFEKNQSIAYSATTVVESAKENLKSTDSITAQNDENTTNIEDNKTLAISDDNTAIIESTSAIKSIEVQTPQIVNQVDKIAKIIPAKSIWIGIKNLDGNNKRSYTTKNALDINLSIDQLIQTGHGELTLELDGDQKKFTLQKPLRFVVENGSEAEAQEFIKAIKKEFWDATHNCSAYIVDDLAQRSSDDGEPSGTAGIPMLEVLRKNKLVGTAAVVTRYFGGIKLGAGGLVRAYSGSVAGALKECGIAEKILMSRFSFLYDVNSVGRILNILYQQDLFEIADVEYNLRAKIILKMQDSQKAEAEAWLTEHLNMPIELELEGSEYAEVLVK